MIGKLSRSCQPSSTRLHQRLQQCKEVPWLHSRIDTRRNYLSVRVTLIHCSSVFLLQNQHDYSCWLQNQQPTVKCAKEKNLLAKQPMKLTLSCAVTVPNPQNCMHRYDQMFYPSVTNIRQSAFTIIILAILLLNPATK